MRQSAASFHPRIVPRMDGSSPSLVCCLLRRESLVATVYPMSSHTAKTVCDLRGPAVLLRCSTEVFVLVPADANVTGGSDVTVTISIDGEMPRRRSSNKPLFVRMLSGTIASN